jgi:hypothetical protein
MKKLIFTFAISLLITNIYSQSLRVVPYYDWSSRTAFMLSPSPIITGYGPLSDSLSKAHNDSTFYEYNGEYYPIESWADYYNWYVNRYWYNFNQPELYTYYYNAGNDYEMARYICGIYYRESFYPSLIVLSFPGRFVWVNNLSRYYMRHQLRNYIPERDRFLADNEARVKTLRENNSFQNRNLKESLSRSNIAPLKESNLNNRITSANREHQFNVAKNERVTNINNSNSNNTSNFRNNNNLERSSNFRNNNNLERSSNFRNNTSEFQRNPFSERSSFSGSASQMNQARVQRGGRFK